MRLLPQVVIRPSLKRLTEALRRSPAWSSSAMLLEAPVSMREARLDPRAAFLLERLRSIELGLAACPEAQLPSHLSSDLDEAVEQIAELLLATQGVKAQGLCLALARLLEETPRLATRHSQSLGVGFEALKDSRWKARLEILQLGREALRHPRFSERRFLELAKQPESFYKALHSSLPGVDHSAIERWVELERRVRMLRFVRRDKTDGQGNIRFLLARLASGEVVLTSLGLKGAWRVPCGSSAGRTNRALRALYESPSALESRPESLARWLSTFPQSGLTLEQALRCALGRGGALAAVPMGSPGAVEPLAVSAAAVAQTASCPPASLRYASESTRWELLVGGQVLTQLDWPAGQKPTVRALHQFFQSIERLCDFSPPELLDSNHEGQSLLRLALQLCIDSKRPRQARLIYLPSPLEHPLGGVPEVGLQFLSESMERRGWHCSRMELRAEDIERRLPELLGAALIGIGVYVHNRPQAQELVRCLRGAGYEGLIVLGGPETRDIDGLMDDFEGWDAILRGEAEDLLPELAELLCELKADPSQAQRERLWERAKGWEGLAIQAGDELWLCETSSRLKASAIQCPWPFRWRLERKLLAEPATLKMNFTRGCPYLCSFCPNHQGRNFRSAYAEGIVAFMARALAEGLEWSESLKQRLAPALFPTEHAALDLDLDLAMSLALLDLGGMSRRLDRAEAALAEWIAVPIADWDQRIELELGPVLDLEPLHSASARLKAQRRWSRLALLVLAERQRARRSATPGSPPELEGFSARPFIVETSEDNTLVNRAEIRAVLERRRALGFSSELIFNPGQNTVRDFFDGRGRLDEAWIDALVQDNPMAIALGTDGASNAVLRQNRKPAYQIEDVLALNRALGQRTVRVANNVILLSPETNAREAIEAFVLYLLLPIPWRDYGSACNLRVIKEDTSLARDEGLLFSPEDSSWDEPLRDAETAALLARWSLDSTISNNALRQRIRDLLALDALAKRELHTVIESWRRGVDGDRELQALAALIDERCGEAAEHETLLEAVLALERWRNEVGLVDGLCKQTFRESLALTRAAASSL